MKKLLKPSTIAVALFAVLLLAAIYNQFTSLINQFGITVNTSDKAYSIAYEDMVGKKFTGTIVDGKGESSTHEYEGRELSELFKKKGIKISEDSVIVAKAADNYEVEISGSEILKAGNVYVAVASDGVAIQGMKSGTQGCQLLIFGDKDSKRCVRYLSTFTIK